MDWETSKENYRPLRQGREPSTVMQEHRSLSISDKKEEIEAQRRAFWEEIASYNGNDPLEAWLRFIKWTQDTFSSGGLQSQLLPLLERATRDLQSDPRYQQDPRYLRTWIQYADLLPEPKDVFNFLKQNDIGTDYALYYIAFASYLELRGSFSKADATYQEGINRLAKPVERLKQKHVEFQQRMARRIERKAQQEADEGTSGSAPVRSTLASIRSRPTPLSALPTSKAAARHSGSDQQQQAELHVYQDEDVSDQGRPPWSTAAVKQTTTSWTKLDDYDKSRKENVQQASVWNGARLKQRKGAAAVPAEELEVYEDEELQGSQDLIPASIGPKVALRRRLDGKCADEGLLQNPVQLHQEVAAKPPVAAPQKAVEMAWDAAALCGADGTELTFEELRAAAWLLRRPPAAGTAPSSASPNAVTYVYGSSLSPVQEQYSAEGSQQSSVACPVDDLLPCGAATAKLEATSAGVAAVSRGLQGTVDERAPVRSILMACPVAAGSVRGDGVEAEERLTLDENGRPMVKPATPQGARVDFHAANAQLCSLSFLDDVTTGFDAYPEPTVTINTQEALGMVNHMFSSTLPHEHIHIPTAGAGHVGGTWAYPEPTVTISTRDALEAINQLFQSQLPHEDDARQSRAGGGFRSAPPHQQQSDRAFATQCEGGSAGSELEVYEDIQFLAQGKDGGGGGALDVYEDTQFLDQPKDGSGGGELGVYEDTQFLAQAKDGGGLDVYEDTQFLDQPKDGGGGGGLGVYEDTRFLSPSRGGLGLKAVESNGDDLQEDELQVYEDTALLNEPPHANGQPRHVNTNAPLMSLNQHRASSIMAATNSEAGELQPFEDDDL